MKYISRMEQSVVRGICEVYLKDGVICGERNM